MAEKINKFWVGLIAGLIVPPITLYIIYLWANKTLTFAEFFKRLITSRVKTDVFIWTVIPVFALFSLCYFKHWDKAGKGLVLPTMIYTFALVILNF